MNRSPVDALLRAAKRLTLEAGSLRFAVPVTCVYNPLEYAWPAHALYLEKYGRTRKRFIFLGMNPGPFGMVQTGIPFGEVAAVRDWLGIHVHIRPPPQVHPQRPVLGFDCPRSEVSGKRLWGLFAERYGPAEKFFAEHLVINYCPLAFVEAPAKNRTPDKLPVPEKNALFEVCDRHLRAVADALGPEWVIGVGDFAAGRIAQVFSATGIKQGCILHPSPANPQANRGWGAVVIGQLQGMGVW